MSEFISVGKQFFDDVYDLELIVKNWQSASRNELFKTFRRIGVAWKAEAMKRIPVKTGMARQHVVTNTYWENEELYTETGTNLVNDEGESYPSFLEFGTDHIAGGKVKALGNSPLINDLQAIHTWPAKEADETDQTSASIRKIDGGSVLRNKQGSVVGGPQEQMPWLRPSFNRIRDWSMDQIINAVKIPK